MMKIKEAILVEGKYDKIKLSQIVDTSIICSDGFSIYKDKKMIDLLKQISASSGLIVLTDSDSAGFRIRNFIKNSLEGYPVKHAFIPDIYGKESRKDKPSKEGKLGVEGMEETVLKEALKHCGATVLGEEKESILPKRVLTKIDFYKKGFSGGTDSAKKRSELLIMLGLPEKMSSNMLLDVLNTFLASGFLEETINSIFFND
ncbi:MAG: DUF4093 domain-containing protein [Clostridia bacterium]|nr:DUF4093 domain-containing protein [Clostridia bacterium]